MPLQEESTEQVKVALSSRGNSQGDWLLRALSWQYSQELEVLYSSIEIWPILHIIPFINVEDPGLYSSDYQGSLCPLDITVCES